MKRKDILERKEEIQKWIAQHYSRQEICRELKCRNSTLRSYLKKLDIVYAGNQGGKGRKTTPVKTKAAQYLWNGSTINPHKLKLKLLKEGIKAQQCESCKTVEWLTKPVPLELHHIDGNRYNNELGNLQILCPNCHAQTDNHAGKKAMRP